MPITINGTSGISGVDGSAGTPSLKGSDTDTGISFATDVIIASTGGTERFRCDSSGRMLVGTSTSRSTFFNAGLSQSLQIESVGSGANRGALSIVSNSSSEDPGYIVLGRTAGTTIGATNLVSNSNWLGLLSFQGSDGTDMVEAASIAAYVDNTPGANDMPGRLVFSTTADGASSTTERFRIDATGSFYSVIPNGSTLYPQFACRAWVNFDGTTASPSTRRGSGNVSSVTKNGTGDYTVNFTTAMPDANYSPVIQFYFDGASVFHPPIGTLSTSSLGVRGYKSGTGNFDVNGICVAIFR